MDTRAQLRKEAKRQTGAEVIKLAEALVGRRLGVDDTYRNTRAGQDRELWDFGWILATGASGDLNLAAQRLVRGLNNRILELREAKPVNATLDAFVEHRPASL
jgi:hypothetical protein